MEKEVVQMEKDQKISLEMITPLTEDIIKSFVEQYHNHAHTAAEGAMEYFQWLQGWSGVDDRSRINNTAKAFQAAETLKDILTLLGQERVL